MAVIYADTKKTARALVMFFRFFCEGCVTSMRRGRGAALYAVWGDAVRLVVAGAGGAPRTRLRREPGARLWINRSCSAAASVCVTAGSRRREARERSKAAESRFHERFSTNRGPSSFCLQTCLTPISEPLS